MRRSLCHTFAPDYCILRPFFRFIASLQQPTKNLESGSMMYFYPFVLFTKSAVYPPGNARRECRMRLWEKYGVGNFIVAFAEWGAFARPRAASKAAEEMPVFTRNSSLTGMTSTGKQGVSAADDSVWPTNSARWFSGNAVLVRCFIYSGFTAVKRYNTHPVAHTGVRK